jgi:hypothetical protein
MASLILIKPVDCYDISLKWQWIFSLDVDRFLPSITDKTFAGLDYMSKMQVRDNRRDNENGQSRDTGNIGHNTLNEVKQSRKAQHRKLNI